MSQKISAFEPVIRRLERQAAELIHKDTDLLTAVRGLTFNDIPISGTAASEWDAQYGYCPMAQAFYCKELAGFTTTELSEYLGFDPEQFAPDKTALGRTTLARAWRGCSYRDSSNWMADESASENRHSQVSPRSFLR
jgi:hypothetical protein